MAVLDLCEDVVALTEALCNIQSVSHHEAEICDAIEAELRKLEHLDLVRIGNNLVARTNLGRAERVVLAGHLDTVPQRQSARAQRWHQPPRTRHL